MLPASHRLRRSADFSTTRAARAGRSALVVHLTPGAPDSTDPVRVGFTVSKAVGNSVIRHRVVRRLREAVRPMLAELPAGATVVIRALPPAASSPVAELRGQIASAVRTITARLDRPAGTL